MDNLRYVLKFDEAVLMPKNKSSFLPALKLIVWIIIGIIVVGSLVFHDNLFDDISWTTRLLLIAMGIIVLFVDGKKENVPSPAELRFYDDSIVLYRPKRFYSKKVTRMEFNKLNYSDVRKCVYKVKSGRVHIYGNVHATWYNYDSSGNVPQAPTYNRVVNDTLCYFSTKCSSEIDFKQIIETYSPIEVLIEDI